MKTMRSHIRLVFALLAILLSATVFWDVRSHGGRPTGYITGFLFLFWAILLYLSQKRAEREREVWQTEEQRPK
jgi:predicted membrane protein